MPPAVTDIRIPNMIEPPRPCLLGTPIFPRFWRLVPRAHQEDAADCRQAWRRLTAEGPQDQQLLKPKVKNQNNYIITVDNYRDTQLNNENLIFVHAEVQHVKQHQIKPNPNGFGFGWGSSKM